jgi:hypothetical protein
MARTAKTPARSAAQLRVLLRHWKQRALIGVVLTVLGGLGVLACWLLNAHGIWWFASIAVAVSAFIEVLADINACCDIKKRIDDAI